MDADITTIPLIQLIEELSMNAWPALQTVWYDGWALRFAGGYTRRANSIASLFPSSRPFEEKVAHCRELYSRQGQATVFKMTTAAEAGLDEFLAGQGYTHTAPTSNQLADLTDPDRVPAPTFQAVTSSAELSAEWLAAYCVQHNIEQQGYPLIAQMLNTIVPQRRFMALHEHDRIVSIGLGVVERGYIGLYGIATIPEFRNRGLGRQLVLHLLAWGKVNGATRAYLNVVAENAPALRLYSQTGFREVYRYWYRVKPL